MQRSCVRLIPSRSLKHTRGGGGEPNTHPVLSSGRTGEINAECFLKYTPASLCSGWNPTGLSPMNRGRKEREGKAPREESKDQGEGKHLPS